MGGLVTLIQDLKTAINNAHLQRREVLVSSHFTELDINTPYNLQTTFDITIPSWTKRLSLRCRFGNDGETDGYVDFAPINGTYSYTALHSSTGTFYAAAFSYGAKVLTVLKVMRLADADESWDTTTTKLAIVSIIAYGDFTIV